MVEERNEQAEIEYYSAVRETSVEWLWYPYIPFGKITLLQGDPGDGKSTFILNLISRITTGGLLPDGDKTALCHNVIYQCSEDSYSDTIKPRLISAGADCDKVAYIVENGQTLTVDDPRVEDALMKTGARLLVFDPIQAYIPPDSDMLNASKMRNVMKRLAEVAEKYKCAIVLIGHMTKASSGKNLYRGLGSIDIAAIARSVLMIKRDEDDPGVRYMFPIKTSLAHEGNAVRFMFDKELGFQFLGPCEMDTIAQPLSNDEEDSKKSHRAEKLILAMLSVESQPSKRILSQMKTAGISERTVRSVTKKLGIKAVRRGNAWYWKLPEREETKDNI